MADSPCNKTFGDELDEFEINDDAKKRQQSGRKPSRRPLFFISDPKLMFFSGEKWDRRVRSTYCGIPTEPVVLVPCLSEPEKVRSATDQEKTIRLEWMNSQ